MASGRMAEVFNRHVWPPVAAGMIRALLDQREVAGLQPGGDRRVCAGGAAVRPVFWHAHILMMVYSYVGPCLVFMIGRHRDGGSRPDGGTFRIRSLPRIDHHGRSGRVREMIHTRCATARTSASPPTARKVRPVKCSPDAWSTRPALWAFRSYP